MQSCAMECDITNCCWAPGKRTNEGAVYPISLFTVCSFSAQSCYKLMEVCQRPPESGKAVHGSLELPPNQHCQVSLPTISVPAANIGELVKPHFNPKAYNHTQNNGAVHPAAKRVARSEVGKSTSSQKEEANCRTKRCAQTVPFLLILQLSGSV